MQEPKMQEKKTSNSNGCDPSLSFEECELAILRRAVDETEEVQQKKMANSQEVEKMIAIVERFISRKKCICYGGTAINNILPKKSQFYNREIEIPDYDFFSPNALSDAKELADEYFTEGYEDVEAKAGVHLGTYKVFVNFIPMADITEIHPELFRAITRDAITVRGIMYAPPNLLRLNMFGELSRPSGDVSRWEKVLKRLTLLNQFYPIQTPVDCQTVDFQRKMDENADLSEKIYFTVRDALIDEDVVFFGGYASSIYAQYMPNDQKRLIQSIPDFDVLSEDPEQCANYVKSKLEGVLGPGSNKGSKLGENPSKGSKKIIIKYHPALGELIPESYEIRVGVDIVAFIYSPIACHNYNVITVKDYGSSANSSNKLAPAPALSEMDTEREIRIATIDTMLSFYLAFLYADANYYYKDRILCMAKFLFDVEQKNRLNQEGVLKRFSIDCYGKQPTLESIRMKKTEMFEKLKNNRGSEEYQRWFLKYSPIHKNKNKSISSFGPKKEEINMNIGENNREKKAKRFSRRKRRMYPRRTRNVRSFKSWSKFPFFKKGKRFSRTRGNRRMEEENEWF